MVSARDVMSGVEVHGQLKGKLAVVTGRLMPIAGYSSLTVPKLFTVEANISTEQTFLISKTLWPSEEYARNVPHWL